MSRKPSFANLRATPPATLPTMPPGATASVSDPARFDTHKEVVSRTSDRPASRENRKQIAGFFRRETSLALHMLALRQDRSLQSLMAEAFDDVLRKHGESPVGE